MLRRGVAAVAPAASAGAHRTKIATAAIRAANEKKKASRRKDEGSVRDVLARSKAITAARRRPRAATRRRRSASPRCARARRSATRGAPSTAGGGWPSTTASTAG